MTRDVRARARALRAYTTAAPCGKITESNPSQASLQAGNLVLFYLPPFGSGLGFDNQSCKPERRRSFVRIPVRTKARSTIPCPSA